MREAEYLTIEENAGRATVGRFLEELGDQTLVLPEGLEDAEVEADVVHSRETSELLLALDHGLGTEHRDEIDLREVELGDGEAALVPIQVAFETVAVRWASPEVPAFADELSGVEGLRAIDLDDLRFADYEARSVLQEIRELTARLRRVADDRVLQSKQLEVETAPIRVRGESRHDLMGLVESDLSHDILQGYGVYISYFGPHHVGLITNARRISLPQNRNAHYYCWASLLCGKLANHILKELKVIILLYFKYVNPKTLPFPPPPPGNRYQEGGCDKNR